MKSEGKKGVMRRKAREILCRIRGKEAKERKIFARIRALSCAKNIHDIFTYVSRDEEVDTLRLIRFFLRNKKRVFVPRISPDKKTIRVYRITRLSCLKKGVYDIPEPVPDRAHLSRRRSFDLVLVPGLAFDRKKRRLGRGGGYFDRFLRGVRGRRVGLCFREQLCASLPEEKHDVPMDLVVSD